MRRSMADGIDVGHRPSFCPTARRRADPMGSTSWPVAGGEVIRLHLRLRSASSCCCGQVRLGLVRRMAVLVSILSLHESSRLLGTASQGPTAVLCGSAL